MNRERCNELNFSFVRGLGSVVSEKCEKATNIEILMKAASVVAIAVWLGSPLTEVAIQFDGRNGQRNWIEDWNDLICGEPNVVIEEECGR
eukprot:scaffold32223_cov83-Cyclotella_meneghiniana.AAC.2